MIAIVPLLGGLLVAGVLALVAWAAGRRRNPAVAHVLWLLVLLKLLVPPFVHAPILPPALRPAADEIPIREAPSVADAPPSGVAPPADVAAPPPADRGAGDTPAPVVAAAGPAPSPARGTARPSSWVTSLLVAAWIAGSLAVAGLSLGRILRFSRALRGGAAPRPSTAAAAVEAARQIGLCRVPPILVVPARVPPLVWAVGRARVVLPAAIERDATPPQLHAVLVHELAHVLRRDHWVRWIELAATIAWWWFPVTWWARRELRAAEEECCDAWAVWALEGDGAPCAHAVLRTMDLLASKPVLVPAAASGFGSFRLFERRLTMMFQSGIRRDLRAFERALLVVVAAAALPIAASWGTVAAAAQEDAGASPSSTAALDAVALPPVPAGLQPGPEPVVTIDGVALGAADLAREILALNETTAVETLVMRKVLAMELAARKTELDAKALHAEAARLLAAFDPSAVSLEAFQAAQPRLASELMAVARDAIGWRLLADLPPGAAAPGSSDHILMQLAIRKTMDRYQVRRRSAGAELPAGVTADVTSPDGPVANITEAETLDLLRTTVRPRALADLREVLIDDYLVGRELAARKQAVTPAEARDYVAAMNQKYKPPFDWRMICQFKGLSPALEVRTFCRLAGWKRLTGFVPDDEETRAFLAARSQYFSGAFRNVSQIVVRTVDPVTEKPLPEPKLAEAEAKIREMRRLVEEGFDFGTLAETRSEDPVTARGGGVVQTPVKQYGAQWDRESVEAIWALAKPGDVSPPVRRADGWSLFKLDKITAGKQTPDLATPAYRDWIQDELERDRLAAYVAALRAKASIRLGGDSALSGGW
jgi:beta-lactamase regulating signal transducer with metallopeptidase domain